MNASSEYRTEINNAMSTINTEFFNHSNGSSFPSSIANEERSILTIINIVVCVAVLSIGLIGNSAVLLVYISGWSRLKPFEIYITSLALADLIGTIVIPTQELNQHFGGSFHHLGIAGCRLLSFLSSTSITVSAFTLVAISIDRYIIIKWPLQAHSNKLVFCIIIAIWLSGMGLATMYTVDGRMLLWEHNGVHFCMMRYSDREEEVIIVFLIFIVQSGIPLIILVFIYSLVIYELYQSETGKVFENRERDKRLRHIQNKKVTKLVIIVVVTFFICVMPQRLFFLLYTVNDQFLSRSLFQRMHSFLIMLLMANSCLNPVVYSILHTSFRSNFLRTLCCCSDYYTSRPWESAFASTFTHVLRKASSILSKASSRKGSEQSLRSRKGSVCSPQTARRQTPMSQEDLMKLRASRSSSVLREMNRRCNQNQRKTSAPSRMETNNRKLSNLSNQSSLKSVNEYLTDDCTLPMPSPSSERKYEDHGSVQDSFPAVEVEYKIKDRDRKYLDSKENSKDSSFKSKDFCDTNYLQTLSDICNTIQTLGNEDDQEEKNSLVESEVSGDNDSISSLTDVQKTMTAAQGQRQRKLGHTVPYRKSKLNARNSQYADHPLLMKVNRKSLKYCDIIINH